MDTNTLGLFLFLHSILSIFLIYIHNFKNAQNLDTPSFNELYHISGQTKNVFLNEIFYLLQQELEPTEAVSYTEILYPNKYPYKYNSKESYCEENFNYYMQNPESIYLNFTFTDMISGLEGRESVEKMGIDLHPDAKRTTGTNFKKYLNPMALMLFVYKSTLLRYWKVNHQIKSPFQTISIIPGSPEITSKNNFALNSNKYLKKLQEKNLSSCINSTFLESYYLGEEEECQQFFSILRSEDYLSKIYDNSSLSLYIIKIGSGSHRGNGIELLTREKEKELLEDYRFGYCENKNNVVAQKYVTNPMLLMGHKFDFRVYLLIASVNPLIVYFHEGFLRVSLKTYDISSTENSVHFTNTEFSKSNFNDEATQLEMNMSESELRDFQSWSFQEFQDYLMKEKLISENDWIEKKLKEPMIKAISSLSLIANSTFLHQSGFYMLFGVDFIMDDQQNLWLLEVNAGPSLNGTSPAKHNLLLSMVTGLLEIEFALVKSRVKRLINYFNGVWAKYEYEESGRSNLVSAYKIKKLIQKDKEKILADFREINKDKVDNEFSISEMNSWIKVIDMSINPQFIHNSIQEECITKFSLQKLYDIHKNHDIEVSNYQDFKTYILQLQFQNFEFQYQEKKILANKKEKNFKIMIIQLLKQTQNCLLQQN